MEKIKWHWIIAGAIATMLGAPPLGLALGLWLDNLLSHFGI